MGEETRSSGERQDLLGKRFDPTGGKEAPFDKEELGLAKFNQPTPSTPNKEEEKIPPPSSLSWLFLDNGKKFGLHPLKKRNQTKVLQNDTR
jgi:hypothetical protein